MVKPQNSLKIDSKIEKQNAHMFINKILALQYGLCYPK